MSGYFRLGQIISSKFSLSLVNPDDVRLCQVFFRLDQVISVYFNLGQVMSGWTRLGQVSTA
jgi:hypothetical protein